MDFSSPAVGVRLLCVAMVVGPAQRQAFRLGRVPDVVSAVCLVTMVAVCVCGLQFGAVIDGKQPSLADAM